MKNINWLRNTVRNNFRRTFIGKAIVNLTYTDTQSIHFVSATRLSEEDFWIKSFLGRSLRPRLNHTTIKASIAYKNTRGLPEVYNEAIRQSDSDILVFLHDDVWLEDTQLTQKIRLALKFHDIAGVAGNIRRTKGQPAWLFLRGKSGELVLDKPNLSGEIKHGEPGRFGASIFGPTPANCQLLDGVFIAANRKYLIESDILFDPQFKFDFYDMDFCRSAKASGLRLTTWPIDLIHQSSGAFGNPNWIAMETLYFKKWK